MSNFQYGQDILQDALLRAGERTDLSGGAGSSDYLAAAKRYVMRAYYDTLTDYPFPRSLSSPPGILNTVAKETGTVTVTKGSVDITFGAVISTTMAGRKFYVDSDAILYRVATHTAGTTAATLDATYKEASGSGVNFTIYQDEYDLASDCLTIHSAWDRANPQYPIEIISQRMAQDLRSYGIGTEGWRVEELSIIEGGKARIRPWSAEARTIEYAYVKRPTTLTWDGLATDIPSYIDEEHRHLLSDYAAAFILHDKKDETWKEKLQLYNDELLKMKGKHLRAQNLRVYRKPGQGVWG